MISNTTALDIAIGLVLVYFIYSLLVSIIGEMLSSWFGIRARLLRQGIASLLNDRIPGSYPADFASWIKDSLIIEPSNFKRTTAGRFYAEASINLLAKKGENHWYSIRKTKPSYISKEAYSKTLLSMFNRKGQGVSERNRVFFSVENNSIHLQPETHKKFREMLLASNGDYRLFTTNLEDEYTEMMDRITGWYKRKVGFLLFWVGFIICAIFNVDTFQIVQILTSNPKARQDMIRIAQDMVKSDQNAATQIEVSPDDPTYLAILEQGYGKAFRDAQDADFVLGKGWAFPYNKERIEIDHADSLTVCNLLRQALPYEQQLQRLQKLIDSTSLPIQQRRTSMREFFMRRSEYRFKILEPLETLVDHRIHNIISFRLDQKEGFIARVQPGPGLIFGYVFYRVAPPWKPKFWGIALSALALSLGASFWFDLLRRLISIRSAGIKPEEKQQAAQPLNPTIQARSDGKYIDVRDPVEEVLSDNRKSWEHISGVLGINRIIARESSDSLSEQIEIVFHKNAFIKGSIPASVETTLGNTIKTVPITFVAGESALLQPNIDLTQTTFDAPARSIVHQSTGAWGTAAGLFKDISTGKPRLLSCGHVLRSDDSGYIKDAKDKVSIKLNDQLVDLGKVLNLMLTNFIDAAVVEISKSDLENNFFQVGATRVVNSKDEAVFTKVNIKTLRGDKAAIIYSIDRSFKVSDKVQDFFMYKLIFLRNDLSENTPEQQLTIPGDSGSLITDQSSGEAIAIHIGSFKINQIVHYAAIGLHEVMSLFHLKPFNQ